MSNAIAVEPFSRELYEEILPLARKCWSENTEQKLKTCAFYGDRDFAVEPDYETYQQIDKTRPILILTLRDSAILTGYVVGLLYNSWHHKRIKCIGCDSVYVEPSYRSFAPVLIKRFEKEAAERGVEIIGWPTTQNGPVHELLKAMNYVGDDIVMEKRLCV